MSVLAGGPPQCEDCGSDLARPYFYKCDACVNAKAFEQLALAAARAMKKGTWLEYLAAAVADVEAKHPTQEVVGFRHGRELDSKASENQGLSFVPVPKCGGWLALRARGDRREASAPPAVDKMQAARDLAAVLDGIEFFMEEVDGPSAKEAGLVIAYVSKGDERLKLCGALEGDYAGALVTRAGVRAGVSTTWNSREEIWRVTGPEGASFQIMSGDRVWCEGLVFPLPAADHSDQEDQGNG